MSLVTVDKQVKQESADCNEVGEQSWLGKTQLELQKFRGFRTEQQPQTGYSVMNGRSEPDLNRGNPKKRRRSKSTCSGDQVSVRESHFSNRDRRLVHMQPATNG